MQHTGQDVGCGSEGQLCAVPQPGLPPTAFLMVAVSLFWLRHDMTGKWRIGRRRSLRGHRSIAVCLLARARIKEAGQAWTASLISARFSPSRLDDLTESIQPCPLMSPPCQTDWLRHRCLQTICSPPTKPFNQPFLHPLNASPRQLLSGHQVCCTVLAA